MFNPSIVHKPFPSTTISKPVSDITDFLVIGEMERSNSGKTVKIYVFENGLRCFVGQVTCSSLRELLDGSSLKVDISKYRNANKVKTSDTAN
jgi:hypothetical protein